MKVSTKPVVVKRNITVEMSERDAHILLSILNNTIAAPGGIPALYVQLKELELEDAQYNVYTDNDGIKFMGREEW